ncbi:hypothetical protein G6F68_015249 [Rhizopus microsporus]|nr:hypothetical protein G6F68_015249 [Rhizopus microsporus]
MIDKHDGRTLLAVLDRVGSKDAFEVAAKVRETELSMDTTEEIRIQPGHVDHRHFKHQLLSDMKQITRIFLIVHHVVFVHRVSNRSGDGRDRHLQSTHQTTRVAAVDRDLTFDRDLGREVLEGHLGQTDQDIGRHVRVIKEIVPLEMLLGVRDKVETLKVSKTGDELVDGPDVGRLMLVINHLDAHTRFLFLQQLRVDPVATTAN